MPGTKTRPAVVLAGNAPAFASGQTGPAARSGAPVVQRVVPTRSPPLRTLAGAPPASSGPTGEREAPEVRFEVADTPDSAVQRSFGRASMPAPLMTFDGLAGTGPVPPDVEGDVGPTAYVEWVNLNYAVYDRSGTVLQGPTPGNAIFSALPSGLCKTTNNGDPIVLYDQLADRWVLSQFAYHQIPRQGPYFQCIAVSQTGDPLGAYCLYPFQVSADVWNDYGKIALWPDGYYFSFGGVPDSDRSAFTPVAWAVERQKMLACQQAGMVYFDGSNAPALAGTADPMLPADLEGSVAPPAGRPNPYLMSIDGSPDRLSLFEFHVDWASPAASTFTKKADLPVPAFDTSFSCNTPTETRQCIPQPDTTNRVDVLAKQLMKRLTYRRFGDHESLVVNQSVDADTDHAAIRWYELRDPNGSPTVHQAGTFAPDTDHRWLGSAAMDGHGDLAIAYNDSSATTYPSLRYAGRLPSDPPSELAQGEATLIAGHGSQEGPAVRWGDYSSLSVDPVDDCTFWYAGEYYPVTSGNGWHTGIGTFRFPQCGAPTAVAIRSFAARRTRHGVRVAWRTGSETGILGFNVYRSAGGGPILKLNRLPLAAKRAGTARAAGYRFDDRAAARGMTYTYRLQIVERNGRRSWYGAAAQA